MMQKIIYVVCSLLAIVQGVNAQFLWEETHPSSKDNVAYVYHSLTGISSLGSVISVVGHIYDSTQIIDSIGAYHVSRSSDDGLTWTEHDLGLPKRHNQGFGLFPFYDIQQISPSHCIMVGRDYINNLALNFHTFDEGKTWSSFPFPENGTIVTVHFSDSLNGVVVLQNNGGQNQSFYITSDGGKIFTKKALLNTEWGFVNCYYYGDGRFRGFEQFNGRVYSNLISSEQIDSTSPIVDADVLQLYGFRGCEFSGDTIIAFGYYSSDGTFDVQKTEGIIARSSNGGKTWSETQRFPHFYMLFSSTIPNKDTVIVVGGSHLQRPMYLQSTDNGITWRTDTLRVDSGSVERIEDIKMTGNGTPIAITRTVFAGGAPTIIARGTHTTSSVKPNKNADGITVYPNPATTSLQIISATPNSTIKFIDALGRTVMTQTSNDGKTTLDVSKLSRGMYEMLIGNSVQKVLLVD